jgi:hypothetical protein
VSGAEVWPELSDDKDSVTKSQSSGQEYKTAAGVVRADSGMFKGHDDSRN